MVESRVNDALDEIAIATDWNHFRARMTFNTEIGEPQYQLPAGGREVIQLRYTETGQPIQLWTVQEAARRGAILETPGRASHWLEDGKVVQGSDVLYQFRLAPIPDSIEEVELEYYYHPSEVASGSVLPVQDQLIVLVKDQVRSALLERDQKYDAADRARRRFESNLAKLVRKENRKVAAVTQLQPTDIKRARRSEPIFDPAHYRNS